MGREEEQIWNTDGKVGRRKVTGKTKIYMGTQY
jgi:hypothetical protein